MDKKTLPDQAIIQEKYILKNIDSYNISYFNGILHIYSAHFEKSISEFQERSINIKIIRLILIISVLLAVNSNFASEWLQYLGPDKNSKSSEKGLLRIWPEGGPEILWTITVGEGFGGPVVKDGKVYMLYRDDIVGDNLRCFDLSTGKELWNSAIYEWIIIRILYKDEEFYIMDTNFSSFFNNKTWVEIDLCSLFSLFKL